MSRKIQVSDSSSSEASTSDDADSDYESTYDSGSTNESDSTSTHDSPSTSMIKGIEITMNINPNRIQDILRFKPFLSSKATRAKKRHTKSEKAPSKTKKPRTRAEVSTANNWNCGDCDFTCVSIELLREHVETSHTHSKSIFYECKLCLSLEKSLYSHYGKYHVIDFTENLLFNDGTVLVFSSVNTNDGKAEWFVKQKAKAELRLRGHMCRLCEFETDFESEKRLKHHYTAYHKVHLKCLDIVKYLFRMERNAHLETTDGPSTSKAKTPTKLKKETKNINKEVPDTVPQVGLVMYVCKCGVAKETYDASVEHAQKHLALDYNPNTKKCTRCDLTFETGCFPDHASRHGDEDTNVEVFKKLEYDFSTLLSNDWFNMFDALAKSLIVKIMASSLYKYTRSVKLNWDSNTGIPLYKCGMCNLIVEPAKVDNHSENYGACVNFGPKGLECTICRMAFSTAKALKIHMDDHENNGAFRVIVFNNENDMQFNKALKMKQYDLHSSGADSQESNEQEAGNARRPEANELEKNVEARVAQFCAHCNQCVFEYEDHIAGVNESKKKMDALMAMKDDVRQIINEHEDTGTKDAEQAASHNYGVVVHDAIGKSQNGDSVEKGNPRRAETNELENNYDARGARFCGHCKQFVPNYEEHIAGIENAKNKKDTLMEMKDSRGIINEYNTDTAGKDAEPAASQNNSVPENSDGQSEDDVNIIDNIDTDAGDVVLPWDSDSDSCDDGEPLITTQAQIHIDIKDY